MENMKNYSHVICGEEGNISLPESNIPTVLTKIKFDELRALANGLSDTFSFRVEKIKDKDEIRVVILWDDDDGDFNHLSFETNI